MSIRKYLSGYEKRKKKRKTEEFLQSQVGAIVTPRPERVYST